MQIIKTKTYIKDLQKKIKNKHKKKEQETIEAIEELMIQSKNRQEVIINPLSRVYNIEKKQGNLKEIYTANINMKLRMYIKPIGEYPYKLEKIVEVELREIDGAEVIAGENIIVLGDLRGLAHAGAKGNKEAIIAASSIEAPQLRISNIIKEREREEILESTQKTYAYVDADGKMELE